MPAVTPSLCPPGFKGPGLGQHLLERNAGLSLPPLHQSEMTVPPRPYPDGRSSPSCSPTLLSLFGRGRVAQGSAISGYRGFPAKCPGTGGTVRVPSELTKEDEFISPGTHHAPSLQSSPSPLAPSTSVWHPHIHPRRALGAQLEPACSAPHRPVYRKGSPVFPRGTSRFPLSVLAVGLITLPHPQMAL